MVNTPELISSCSTDEDEVVVHRPRNRRGSSRIVDERISDSSSDDDVQIIISRKIEEKPIVFEIEDDEPEQITKTPALDDSNSTGDSIIRTAVRSIGPFSSAELRLLPFSTSGIQEIMTRPVVAEPASVKVSRIVPDTAVGVAVPPSLVPAIARPITAAAKALVDLKPNDSKIAPPLVTVKKIPSVALKAVSSVPVKAVLSYTGEAAASLATPLISVRARSGSSDYTFEKSSKIHDVHSSINSGISSNIRSSMVSSANSNEDRDTVKWKDRLWPSRALNSFCRSIMRCKPPVLQAGQRLPKGASDQVRLTPHWSKSDLQSVQTSYDSLAAHNSAFFLLIVEECIESPSFRGDSFESNSTGSNGWTCGEVLQVLSESKPPVPTSTAQKQLMQNDPRLGTVLIMKMAISPYMQSSALRGMDDQFQGGDLLLMQCSSLGRYIHSLYLFMYTVFTR
jgi:hypothetical protein